MQNVGERKLSSIKTIILFYFFIMHTVFPNNKPHITKEVKACINRKKAAFMKKKQVKLKVIQK